MRPKTTRTISPRRPARARLYKLALAHARDGRLTRAVSALQQAIRLNPLFHEAHYVLGLCFKDREELAEARAAFARASAIDPDFIPAREELAELHRLQQRTRDEIDQLDALYALDPDKPERLIAVGCAHLRAGNRDLAVMTLAAPPSDFQITPASTPHSDRYGWMRLKKAAIPSDLRKALEALAPVAEQSTASSETLGLYGRALALAGRHVEAEASSSRRRSVPVDPEVLPHHASVAQRLGHLEDARQALVSYSPWLTKTAKKLLGPHAIGDLSMQLNDAVAAVAWYRQVGALRHRVTRRCWRASPTHSGAPVRLSRPASRSDEQWRRDPNHPLAQTIARRLQAR